MNHPRGYRCTVCGTKFTSSHPNARTCSSKCRQQAYRERIAAGQDAPGDQVIPSKKPKPPAKGKK